MVQNRRISRKNVKRLTHFDSFSLLSSGSMRKGKSESKERFILAGENLLLR